MYCVRIVTQCLENVMTGVLTDNMELETNMEQQRLEDLLGQEAVKMGQTILLIQVRQSAGSVFSSLLHDLLQVPSADGSGQTQVKTIEVDHQ